MIDIRERIKIGRTNISKNDFCAILNKILGACRILRITPSFFELMLLMAALYYYESKCDFIVAEVGIGGRLDSTNVLNGSVCAITGVSMDHMEYLGNDPVSIAREKTAIVKPGSILCIGGGCSMEGLVEFIKKQAAAHGASLIMNANEIVEGRIASMNIDGSYITLNSPSFKNLIVHVPLPGDYQLDNAVCAMCIIEALKISFSISISSETAAEGFKKTKWPGRFEHIRRRGFDIILDGAHNVEGMLGLSRNLKTLFPKRKIITILSILAGKQYERMIEIIAGVSNELIIVGIKNVKKNVEVKTLFEKARSVHPGAIYMPGVESALEYVFSRNDMEKETDNLCCLSGSLYLVGEARNILVNKDKIFKEKEKEIDKIECVKYEPCIKA